jgi:hypothetical protein
MDQHNLHHLDENKICELCKKHDPLVKNYEEDYELQTSLRDYIEKTTGERVNTADVALLCDSCYAKIQDMREEEEE